MLSENRAERNQMEMFCIDSFVPEDHLLRKIDEAVDFGKIYEIVGDLYCHNNGRPSVDPVVLFKIVFICQHFVLCVMFSDQIACPHIGVIILNLKKIKNAFHIILHG